MGELAAYAALGLAGLALWRTRSARVRQSVWRNHAKEIEAALAAYDARLDLTLPDRIRRTQQRYGQRG